MTVPPHIREQAARSVLVDLRGHLSHEHECQGSRFHSPRPLMLDQYVLDGAVVEPLDVRVVYSTPPTVVWMCGTCADNLGLYLALRESAPEGLPWPVRREFGTLIRALGDKAWNAYVTRRES